VTGLVFPFRFGQPLRLALGHRLKVSSVVPRLRARAGRKTRRRDRQRIEATGGHGQFVVADLTIIDDVQHLAEEVGPVDVPINNGGRSWFGPSSDLETANFDALFAGNDRAPYYLGAKLAPMMAERGSGAFVSLGSMAATVGLSNRRFRRHEGRPIQGNDPRQG
jgi:NAD(P)-dependent dehydrogenase (short-subunit alcohol dehydrogenase family)